MFSAQGAKTVAFLPWHVFLLLSQVSSSTLSQMSSHLLLQVPILLEPSLTHPRTGPDTTLLLHSPCSATRWQRRAVFKSCSSGAKLPKFKSQFCLLLVK